MAKYTDEQIKKALECCSGSTCRTDCPLSNISEIPCDSILNTCALDLINRQEAEIERLNRFKAFFESLCEFDLEVLGYTEDGDTIPFKVLYENAVKEMVGEGE